MTKRVTIVITLLLAMVLVFFVFITILNIDKDVQANILPLSKSDGEITLSSSISSSSNSQLSSLTASETPKSLSVSKSSSKAVYIDIYGNIEKSLYVSSSGGFEKEGIFSANFKLATPRVSFTNVEDTINYFGEFENTKIDYNKIVQLNAINFDLSNQLEYDDFVLYINGSAKLKDMLRPTNLFFAILANNNSQIEYVIKKDEKSFKIESTSYDDSPNISIGMSSFICNQNNYFTNNNFDLTNTRAYCIDITGCGTFILFTDEKNEALLLKSSVLRCFENDKLYSKKELIEILENNTNDFIVDKKFKVSIHFESSEKLKDLFNQRITIGAVKDPNNSNLMSSDNTKENQQSHQDMSRSYLALEKEEATKIINANLILIQKSLEQQNSKVALTLSKQLFDRIYYTSPIDTFINGKFTEEEIELLKNQSNVISINILSTKPNQNT